MFQNAERIRMHFDYFCLFLLNCVAQFYCFELMIDSERIHGVREPEGFTREKLTCPPGSQIFLSSVKYGYRVSRVTELPGIIVCVMSRSGRGWLAVMQQTAHYHPVWSV